MADSRACDEFSDGFACCFEIQMEKVFDKAVGMNRSDSQ
jgi:hypothetical protein